MIFDYKAKIGILNKNTKFVTRELIKDFQFTAAGAETAASRTDGEKRKKAKRSLYVMPAELLHP